jgi:hypothetical protein
MKRFWPSILVAIGLLLIVGGFFYDVLYAGIPYQDPTPEMSANYDRQARIAGKIFWYGVGIFLLGAVGGIVRRVMRRSRRTVDS